MSIPTELSRDNDERALRWALWIAVVHAQSLGLHEIQGQITGVLALVDQLARLHLEAGDRRRALEREDPGGGAAQ